MKLRLVVLTFFTVLLVLCIKQAIASPYSDHLYWHIYRSPTIEVEIHKAMRMCRAATHKTGQQTRVGVFFNGTAWNIHPLVLTTIVDGNKASYIWHMLDSDKTLLEFNAGENKVIFTIPLESYEFLYNKKEL
jgi:hypothetical protein